MFIFKFISSVGIFTTTSVIGFLYGHRFTARMDNLIYLKQCLKILETEIVYGATPLPEALLNIYTKGNSKVSYIFKLISEDLNSNKGEELIDSFKTVTKEMENKLYLEKEDIGIFLSLGSGLGASDRVDQEKNINLISNQLDMLIEEARREKLKNGKLYKNLGILVGIAIIILLI